MNLHEYQAKQFLKKYGIPVPEGYPADSIEEVEAVMDEHFSDGSQICRDRSISYKTVALFAHHARRRTGIHAKGL